MDAGEPYWKAAGVSDKVKLYICPANDTLVELLAVKTEDYHVALNKPRRPSVKVSSTRFYSVAKAALGKGSVSWEHLLPLVDQTAESKFCVQLAGRRGGVLRSGFHRCGQVELQLLL